MISREYLLSALCVWSVARFGLSTTHKQLAAVGGRFIVRNLNNEVRSVFDLTGFSRLLTIE